MCNTIGNVFRLGIVGGCCLALAMQFFVTFSCSFLETANGPVGIWYIEDDNGECVEWESSEELVKAAQSALTLSTVAGFAAGAMVLFEWLLCEVCCAGCLEGLAFAASWMIGGSVFMIYGIEDCGDFEGATDGEIDTSGCEWGTDATYMTVACAAYFICGFILCCAPQPDPVCKQ